MSRIISLFLLLKLLAGATGTLLKADEADLDGFFKRCPPQRCSIGGPEIRYPLRLDSSPPSCGATGLVLSCSGGSTILPSPYLPPSLPLYVADVNYSVGQITVMLNKPYWSTCLLQNMSLLQFSSSSFEVDDGTDFILVNCSRRIPLTDDNSISSFAGPLSCFSGAADFVYAVDSSSYMDLMPPYCAMISGGGWIPFQDLATVYLNLTSSIDLFIQRREIIFGWWGVWNAYGCADCENSGGRCGFSEARNQSFCYKKHRSHTKLIIGSSVGGTSIIILLLSILLFFTHKKSGIEDDMRLKIENFLATYQNTKPTRYSYSEIKKITARFKLKLGQGGFGTVYKGELSNGVPVAVKLLEIEKSKGDEFINEVATMGRIHHVNVVRLLGFSSEGTMRALVYEFMPNESLEKLIFSKESDKSHQRLSMEKLREIAIGIAQGIEYLHQGCDQRILHFDIKPHNILLDHSFIPKIADFGLAKLCSRDQSMITMTAARGTMGYIAPEIYSRNFGTVSYKSDVYSFGMLLMEMVSGRRNIDPSIEDQSAVYFPEWIYEQLVRGRDIDLLLERTGDEEKIAENLIIVALWCIQWSPMDRPTMARVVQMLLGEIAGLEIPPKPFVSAGLENVMPVNVV